MTRGVSEDGDEVRVVEGAWGREAVCLCVWRWPSALWAFERVFDSLL